MWHRSQSYHCCRAIVPRGAYTATTPRSSFAPGGVAYNDIDEMLDTHGAMDTAPREELLMTSLRTSARKDMIDHSTTVDLNYVDSPRGGSTARGGAMITAQWL